MIETERMTLRRWCDEDALAHNAMCSDVEVMRFLGQPPGVADSHDVVARQNRFLDSYGSCFFAIERHADGVFVGWCGVKPGPDGTPIAGQPEIGWSLKRDAWGQGLALEAARGALGWFWRHHGAPRVSAITVPANVRSRSVMRRLGMIRVADGDFNHPDVADGDPLKRHITYAMERP